MTSERESLTSPPPSQTSPTLGHAHTVSGVLGGDGEDKAPLSPPSMVHSHSDSDRLTMMVSPAGLKRELIPVDGGLYASTHSLTWAGQQSHVMTTHIAADADVNDRAGGTILAPTGRVTFQLSLAAFIAAFGSSLPHGWNTGVLNTPSQLIKDFLNETYTERFDEVPGPQLLNFLWSASVSIYLVGGCGGAFSAGWFANKVGRKRGLLICNVFGFVAAILFATCQVAQSFEMLIIARLVVGFGCGAGSGLVPMYLTEIAPVNVRGAMGVLHQFALTCGILLSQIIGLRQVLGKEDLWPYLLALTGFPCLVSTAVLPFLPESPRYLYVNEQSREKAEHALRIFRQEEDVTLDLEEMKQEVVQQQQEPEWTFKRLFRNKDLSMQLALVCVLAIAQQLSGINVVFYYSTGVFIGAGIPVDYTQYATLCTGIINVLMTGISVPLMEKAGRRKLLLGGMIVMVISATGMTLTLSLKYVGMWMSYFSIVSLVGFVIGFAIGLGSIPQFIGAELFKQGPRPPAMSFAGLLNWLCNVIVGISFPLMAPYTKQYSFIPFIVVVLGFGAFLWWKLPETKGKTYEEIWNHFVKQRHKHEAETLLESPVDKNRNKPKKSAKSDSLANGADIELNIISNDDTGA